MTITRFVDHIRLSGTHAARPPASGAGAVPWGSMYHCTTHEMIETVDATGTWVDFFSVAGSSGSILTTVGDLLSYSASGLGRVPVGPNGYVATADSTKPFGWDWEPSGGGTIETYDAAVTAALTGIVHRWKFDDASGATVADSVGSLPLTLSGTYTRHTASPTGFGTTITATGGAASSGPGSIPIGANDRCIIMLYRSASTASQDLTSLGTGATRQAFSSSRLANTSSAPGNLQLVCWGDDTVVPFPASSGPEVATSAGEWSLLAIGYKNAITTTFLYHDGVMLRKILGGALNTASSNFVAGPTLIGAIDDVIVLNNWPGKLALDRLLSAAAGVAWTPH